jgi:RimJ/RimL family protein N-acetyltransferase
MNSYKAIFNQIFINGNFSIVPLRYQDRIDIMKWRNEQIYHLRQHQSLTIEDQDHYFKTVVNALFGQEKPHQILFSYLENDRCIGYGGLVHINWIDKNAEVSFIMNTELEEKYFSKHWTIFLGLIEQVAFEELKLYKIFTFAFDLRPHLYVPIEDSGFTKEAILKQHCFFNGAYKDVIIHSKFNTLDKL